MFQLGSDEPVRISGQAQRNGERASLEPPVPAREKEAAENENPNAVQSDSIFKKKTEL
jgi:hypothetical protein